MTDQDYAADEQAREVEVVALLAQVLDRRTGKNLGVDGWQATAEAILRALEPIRAAERQEAAREGEQRALSAAANEVWVEMRWQAEQHHRGDQAMTRLGCIERLDVVHAILRDRADGVTGRSET